MHEAVWLLNLEGKFEDEFTLRRHGRFKYEREIDKIKKSGKIGDIQSRESATAYSRRPLTHFMRALAGCTSLEMIFFVPGPATSLLPSK